MVVASRQLTHQQRAKYAKQHPKATHANCVRDLNAYYCGNGNAISQPIQTARGVFRLGSKTQANVNAKQSSADLGQGIILVSSNPARIGRPTLKVRFKGAPMHAKVQGTALIAYLKDDFIQITGVEGRTYLVREGRLGEVVAVDAGKMLLVKPTAKRLPDTVDVNLSDFVKNSPMFNGGLQLAASELIARAIEKQSKNRYLKATPIYLEGAGTEAVIAEGLGDEGQPFESSLTGIDAIERIPRQAKGMQPGPDRSSPRKPESGRRGQVAAARLQRPGGGGGFTWPTGGRDQPVRPPERRSCRLVPHDFGAGALRNPRFRRIKTLLFLREGFLERFEFTGVRRPTELKSKS